MITEQILLSLGFEQKKMSSLPDWYYVFEINPSKEEVPSYNFWTNGEHYMVVYMSPKGLFGEILAYDEFDWSASYIGLRNTDDVLKAIDDLIDDSDGE